MKDIKGILKTIKAIKFLRRYLFFGFLVLALIFAAMHMWVNIQGKPIVVEKLKIAFNRDVTVGSLSTSFPFYVHIKNIEVKGLLKVKEVIAGGGLFDIFRKDFRLSLLKIIRPEVTLKKALNITEPAVTPPADSSVQSPVSAPPAAPVVLAQQNKFTAPGLLIRRLIISDGTLNFTDKIAQDQELAIKVVKINLKVDNLNFSGIGNQIAYFKFSGLVPWQVAEAAGRIEANGWINFFKKDIQASLKVQDIDGVYLYPYYSKWVDLEKARIERAKLNFTSEIQGLNNDITAACRLELTDIVRKPRGPEESKEKAEKIADAVLEIFKALNQGKIVLDFTIKTKMDNPQFGFKDVQTAVETKLTQAMNTGIQPQDVLWLPIKIVEGGVKTTTDLTKAVIEGSFSIGNELKNAFLGAFRKEPKEAK